MYEERTYDVVKDRYEVGMPFKQDVSEWQEGTSADN